MERRRNIENTRALRKEEVLAALNDIPSDQSEGDALPENTDSEFEPVSNTSDSSSGSELEAAPAQYTVEDSRPSTSQTSGNKRGLEAGHSVPSKVPRRATVIARQSAGSNDDEAANVVPEKTSNIQGDKCTEGVAKVNPKPMRGDLGKLVAGSIVVAPDQTQWHVVEINIPCTGRRGEQNVLKDVPGPSPYAKRYVVGGNVSSSWRLLIDDGTLRHIRKCTEIEARRVLQNDDWTLSLPELDAFLGVLYLRGATESKGMEIDFMWSEKYGFPFCKNVMSRDRFREIMRFLRFDEKSKRSERLKTDKFALISEVFSRFVSNCQSNYIPGPYISVDEQLFPSKTRCPFTQFMASKPDKYGQKFWVAVDKDSKYIINIFPYLGKNDERSGDDRLADFVVKKLVDPYLNKGRNVTCDNFFTSLRLAKFLKSNKTSIVGTVNKARREVPICVKKAKEKLYSTKALKNGDMTLTVYQGKPNKNVVILSSMHSEVRTGNCPKATPETVSFYNSTKYGVDVVDQMARKYSVKSASRRWPVHTFFNVMDLSGINAWILYREITKEKISRRDFLLKLGEELTKEYVDSKTAPPPHLPESTSGGSRRRCQVRSACKEGKSAYECFTCNRPVCKKCTKKVSYICVSCDHDSDKAL